VTRSTHHTGTLGLVRASFRRDRLRIAIWVAGITTMVGVSAQSVKALFPTQADLDAAAASSDNPAIVAFQGPAYGLDTVGGQVVFQIGAPGLVLVGLMALLQTGRLTRTEEEAGRLELVRSLPVGRHAPTLAAGIVVGAMCIAVGILTAGILLALDLPVAGSISFGLGYAAVGAVFMAITLVTAQVSENPRLANGWAGLVLGASFILRAVGDAAENFLSWLSPLGWSQQARPFADERWWPFLLSFVVTGALLVVATKLENHRDLGAGLVATRAGPARATPRLASPFALALRLQRGTIAAWTAGTAALALVYGGLTSAIESFIDDNPQLEDFFAQSGGDVADITSSYLATSAQVTALIGSGYAIQSVLRLRSEETRDRTEPILATAVSRWRYWLAHVAVASVGAVLVLVVSGLVLGSSAAAVMGDRSLFGDGLAAVVAYLPAVLVMIGVPALAVGLVPKYAAAAWTMLLVTFVVSFFGTLLELPGWVLGISPFDHIALVPVESLSATSVAVLCAIAAALLGLGAVTYRRRDIPT
jgi:ABC-2 type transport system permease protein